jgi:hypothetical protein
MQQPLPPRRPFRWIAAAAAEHIGMVAFLAVIKTAQRRSNTGIAKTKK